MNDCFYEAPASELIVIDCKGAMMQDIVSWEHGGDFSSPFDGPMEDFAVSGPEFGLYDDFENN